MDFMEGAKEKKYPSGLVGWSCWPQAGVALRDETNILFDFQFYLFILLLVLLLKLWYIYHCET